MSYHFMRTTSLAVLLSFVVTASAAELPEGVRRIKVLNYADCFELSNAETRVTLCHEVGGRVLEYSFRGTNALYLDPEEAKWGSAGGLRPSGRATSGWPARRTNLSPNFIRPRVAFPKRQWTTAPGGLKIRDTAQRGGTATKDVEQ